MLSPDDAKLVGRDSALPGLRACLDPELFIATIQPTFPTARLEPQHITYVRYKPGVSCLVSHQISCDNEVITLSATALPTGAVEQLAKARRWASEQHLVGPWPIIVPNLAMMIFALPFDTALNGLPLLMQSTTRPSFLQKLLPDRPDLWHADVVPIRYKPQRRFVARLDVHAAPQAVIKLYTRSGFPAAQVNAKAFRSGRRVRVPKRLGRSNRHQALILEWLPGRLLVDHLSKSRCDVVELQSVGKALAEIHGQHSRKLPIHSRCHEIDALEPIVAWLSHVCPDQTKVVRKVYADLAEQLQCMTLADAATHGDFYSKQVLIHDGTVAIIDFDEAFRGQAAYDIGMFTAHMIRDAIRRLMPASLLEPVQAALHQGYESLRAIDEPAAALYTAVGLLRLAPHPFRNREPEWREATATMLARADSYLQASRRTARRWAVST